MFDKGRMSFFKVEACGLYKAISKKEQGMDLSETMEKITAWKKGRKLSETLPWDQSLGNRHIANCYLRDIHFDKDSGDYLMVLWKSSTRTGAILGVSEEDEVGTGKSINQSAEVKGKKVVWGHPCYYWVVPSINAIISIKFNHSMCDAELFKYFITSCINNKVPSKNRDVTITPTGRHNISFTNNEGQKLSYKFGMKLKFMETSIADLKKIRKDITHIVVRDTIQVKSRDQKADWLKWINKLGKKVGKSIPQGKDESNRRKVYTAIEASPTIEEMQFILSNNQQRTSEDDDGQSWDNIGFQLKDGSTRFVDRYRLTNSVIMEGTKDEEIKAKTLYKKIQDNRPDLLKSFK